MDDATTFDASRGSPDVWLKAAYELLLESGVDAVKVQPLAKRLSMSRTSFYWSFKDREELLSELLRHWTNKNTGGLVGRTNAYAETIVEALLNVNDCWFDDGLFDSRLEFAVRSWAMQSPAVLAKVREADLARIRALAEMFARFGDDEASADVRARTTYLLQIGYISMQADEDIATRMTRMPEYMAVLTGRKPAERELARFFARHGFPRDRPIADPDAAEKASPRRRAPQMS